MFFASLKRQDLRAGLYPTSYRISRTMLLFRNSTAVTLFLCRVRYSVANWYIYIHQTCHIWYIFKVLGI